jgi:hypothetical protein
MFCLRLRTCSLAMMQSITVARRRARHVSNERTTCALLDSTVLIDDESVILVRQTNKRTNERCMCIARFHISWPNRLDVSGHMCRYSAIFNVDNDMARQTHERKRMPVVCCLLDCSTCHGIVAQRISNRWVRTGRCASLSLSLCVSLSLFFFGSIRSSM